MTIRTDILTGLQSGQATLPKLAPTANPVVRYIEARKLESKGEIQRVGTQRDRNKSGMPRIVWRLA